MSDTNVMKDLSEIVPYNRAGIPLYINTARLSAYPDYRALCHWHDDIEWIHILDGSMNYMVNGKKLTLKRGDSLMINTRQMHYGYSALHRECIFICILFHPCLFTENRQIVQTFLLPVLGDRTLEYLLIGASHPSSGEISGLLQKIAALNDRGSSGFEMEAIGLFHLLWAKVLQLRGVSGSVHAQPVYSELQIQKNMVSYIYQHYMEHLTLDDIASAGNICRSRCCAVFRRYLGQSPIDFLNSCRLSVSCGLLCTSSDTITRIALTCGFSHPSYYSRLFLRAYGCTPREYRAANRRKDVPTA